jgi:hypothetical protein
MVTGYNARQIVAPPTWAPSPYGLLSAVDLRPAADMHWQMGVTWEDVCGGAGTTVVDCATSAPVITGSGMIPAKQATTSRSFWGATPFTVFVEIDCSPIDFYDQRDTIINTAMDRYESYAVERAFWTGFALDRNGSGGVANAVLPHLASNGTITEQMGGTPTKSVTLQQTATVVTGVALNVLDAMGALEGALAGCLNGTGTIHIPQALAPTMALVLQRTGSRLTTPNGNTVALGAGYPGTSPAGATPALGQAWMYATGPIFAYRSTPKIVGDPSQTIDRSTNTMKVIIERTYVMGYDCCLFAQLVNTASFIATSTTTP